MQIFLISSKFSLEYISSTISLLTIHSDSILIISSTNSGFISPFPIIFTT
jgi:hypothetical protein